MRSRMGQAAAVGTVAPGPRFAPVVLVLAAAIALAGTRSARAQEEEEGFLGLDALDLGFATEDGGFSLDLSGILDVEGYVPGKEAPGLVYADHPLVSPRLSLFVDASLGEHLFVFLQARADRGFDPDDHPAQVRPDEYFARWTEAGEDWSVSAQVGKFATPLGSFVQRHDSLRNPLVRAPLPYDFMTSVGDAVAPKSNAAQIARRDIEDRKEDWVPILWGPVYHTGAMLFGAVGDFDMRLAATNAAPCERPEEWTWQEDDGEAIAWSARLGWRAFPGFVVGLDWARGPYYRREAEDSLAGSDREDFDQKLIGVDLEYKVGHLEAWAEVYASDWEAPNIVGDLRALAYYVEAKYTLTPALHLAGRWGQIFFNEIRDASGRRTEWDRASWRAELGVGYLFASNLLGKVQYEVNEHSGGREPHDDMASFSMSLGF